MKTDRRRFLLTAGALAVLAASPARAAAAELELQQPGTLRVAVYANFAPWSSAGKGIETALGRALAERLGLQPQVVEFPADENMNDDLRNMVWRGHYLGHKPGDVMLHVPVDPRFAAANKQVKIFGPYHLETIALARLPERVPAPGGSADASFAVFEQERIGAELDSHASDFLRHILGGRLQPNVTHFRSVAEAVAAMKRGEVAAVMASRSELEAAIGGDAAIALDTLSMPELRVASWPLGMAVKAEHGGLEQALSGAIAELQRSGELARIFAAHGVKQRTP
ncbi:substrate-binding periplasmic protein [Thauera phenylacetica]|uniref:substrate-binding periplasmic protein n=1 Tax=Thauera phenylacetica TaxID=164400 RepID=UPI002B619A71|nr:transporter substrate-binding domain-containing protein [Thauera phenylacetica]